MCWKCLAKIDPSVQITRSCVCPVCNSDLHSCKNCTYYSPGYHYDCRETVEENISDKERANFCDYFKPAREFKDGSSLKMKEEKARKAFDALFS